MSGGGGSKSSSTSQTKTTTSSTTQQQDQRVAATDAAIAIGPNAQGGITINQLPDGAETILQGFIDLTQNAINAATAAGAAALDTQTQLNDVQAANVTQAQENADAVQANTQKWLLLGLGALAVVYLMKGGF